MNYSNPYEPPERAKETLSTASSPSVLIRIAWSFACLVLGVGLSLGLPIMLYKIGVMQDPRGKGEYIFLLQIMLSGIDCVISGVFGAIAGAVVPGRRSIVMTLICLIVTDIIGVGVFWFLPPNGELFIPLYLVSAAIKGAMILGVNQIGTSSNSDRPNAMEA